MKLYLSSYRIPNIKLFSKFLGKDPSVIKMGLILNSKDYKIESERAAKANELLNYFSGLGFYVEEIDLRDYVSDNSSLLEKFKNFDIIWFNGGNTYRLRWAIAESKAEDIISQAVVSGVVYGGDSAGAIIAGPTLKYFDTADDPSMAETVIYDGLKLTDLVILPHWNSLEYSSVLKESKNSLDKEGFKTLPLTDNEFVMVEDGKILS